MAAELSASILPAPSTRLLLLLLVVLLSCCCRLCSPQLTTDEQKLAVDFHNSLRMSVYPTASNMQMLSWSTKLATLAQSAADRCVFEHNYDGEYSGLGENLYKGGADIKSAIMLWYTEGENYNFATGACAPGRYPSYSTCGHWSQVVQASVSSVGCGLKSCSGSNLIVCEYNKGEGQPPYTRGTACSQCPYYASYCYNGLCLTSIQRNALTDPTAAICQPKCNECQYVFYIQDILCQCMNNASCTASVCSAAGTPCVHGTDASSGGSCSCACQAGYSGSQCQYNNNQLDNGIQMRFASGVRSCSYFPTSTYAWLSTLQSPVASAVASILSDFCAGSNSTGNLCCPDTGAAGDPAARFINASDVRLAAGGYPQQEPTGEATVVLYVLRQATDGYCKRPNASDPNLYLNLTAFAQVLSNGNATLATNGSGGIGCCGSYPTVITSPRNSTVQWPNYCLGSSGGSGGGTGGGTGGGSGGSGSDTTTSSSSGLSGTSLIGAIVGGILGAAALVALILVIVLVIVPKFCHQAGADHLLKSAASASPTPTESGSEAKSSSSGSAASLRHKGRVQPWPPQPSTPPPAFVHLDVGPIDADGDDPPVFNAPGPLMGMPFVPDSGSSPPPSFLRRV